ncbi:MAG: iron ABC transporter permease [Pseudomonadota bacterium]
MRNPRAQSSLRWTIPSALMAAVLLVPIATVLYALVEPSGPAWEHLKSTVLADYVVNSVLLMLLTAALSFVIGVSTAWLVACCQFPGRATFSWLLMLPLAAPAYVIAYTYTDLLDVSGPIQMTLVGWLSLSPGDLPLPAVRTLPGAAVLLSLVLYPYVYLLARNSFANRSALQFDAARSLGRGPYYAFFRVALPGARPAIAGGLALVMMETLADFGVVDYFSVPTLSTGIYRTWIGLGDKAAALKLAALMLLFVFVLLMMERASRKGGVDRGDVSRAAPIQLRGRKAFAAILVCVLPVLLGFAIPAITLLIMAVTDGDPLLGRSFGQYVNNSVTVSILAAVIATMMALMLAYAQRQNPSRLNSSLIRLATLGYALPGILLAVALISPVAALDRWFVSIGISEGGINSILAGTIFALMYAYVCRFLTVAYQSVDAGLAGISSDIDAAARTLNASSLKIMGRIHLPMLRPSLLAAAMLVFVDVMRELPATLILRPFNFDTLATRVYRLASDEKLADASTAALCIVAVGVIPVLILNWLGSRKR